MSEERPLTETPGEGWLGDDIEEVLSERNEAAVRRVLAESLVSRLLSVPLRAGLAIRHFLRRA